MAAKKKAAKAKAKSKIAKVALDVGDDLIPPPPTRGHEPIFMTAVPVKFPPMPPWLKKMTRAQAKKLQEQFTARKKWFVAHPGSAENYERMIEHQACGHKWPPEEVRWMAQHPEEQGRLDAIRSRRREREEDDR